MNFTDLLKVPEWSRLNTLVRTWYRDPLSSDLGDSPMEIQAVERALDTSLPDGLREWFRLVGKRLREVQDPPWTLEELVVDEAGLIKFWSENQQTWNLSAPAQAEDYEFAYRGSDDVVRTLDVPLRQVLLGMALSETLIGVWSTSLEPSGPREGALGLLREEVIGRMSDQHNDEVEERIIDYYSELSPVHAFSFAYEESAPTACPLLGDEETLIRIDRSGWLEVAVANSEAKSRLENITGFQFEERAP